MVDLAVAVVIGLGIALTVPELAPLAAIIIGASLGFLRINWAPARIFMGDVGSTWLGYVLGGLLLADCAQSAGKLPLPPADFIALAAHKFGASPGVGCRR